MVKRGIRWVKQDRSSCPTLPKRWLCFGQKSSYWPRPTHSCIPIHRDRAKCLALGYPTVSGLHWDVAEGSGQCIGRNLAVHEQCHHGLPHTKTQVQWTLRVGGAKPWQGRDVPHL